jgi:hypothetical protein
MRCSNHLAPLSRSRVLILAALCLAVAAAPGLAAAAPQAPATAAGFLASLSAAPPPAGSGALQLPPAGARFLTGCSSSADCPTGQLCCPVGGANDGGPPKTACFSPIRGHCPLIP